MQKFCYHLFCCVGRFFGFSEQAVVQYEVLFDSLDSLLSAQMIVKLAILKRSLCKWLLNLSCICVLYYSIHTVTPDILPQMSDNDYYPTAKTYQLMLCGEVIALCAENCRKHAETLCSKMQSHCNVKTGSTLSYPCAFMGLCSLSCALIG